MGKMWTRAEAKYLLENYGRIPTKEICEHLNRTYNSIQAFAKKNNIKKKDKIDLITLIESSSENENTIETKIKKYLQMQNDIKSHIEKEEKKIEADKKKFEEEMKRRMSEIEASKALI